MHPVPAVEDRVVDAAGRVGLAGAAVMGVAFGMVRYAYGLTLPGVRAELGLGDPALGLVGSATFVGFLLALLLATPLARRRGPRAATTVGGACGVVGCAAVALSPSVVVLTAGALVAGSSAGWVWAPYSDVVAAVVAAPQRPRVLAWITTGASGGLVLVGPLALLATVWAPSTSWRWTWGAVAALSAAAALLNLRWVPPVPPAAARPATPTVVDPRALARPLVLAVVLFVGATAYLTYATDAARRGELGALAGPAVFVVAGAVGLVGSATGRVTTRFGPAAVAGGALVAVGAALTVLGAGSGSPVAVLASAAVLGAGNVVGSATLAIWTAERVPERPGAAFTVTLVAGSVAAAATPAAVGALTPVVGLPGVLLAAGGLCVLTGMALVRPAR